MMKTNKYNQAGVTLLLAVMIMSTLTLIATTVAILAIREIRASRASLVSESAYAAAKAGAEEGLWTIKRASISSLSDCPTTNNQSTANSLINYCKYFKGGTIDITAGTPAVVLLYNPNDPNGDVDLSEYQYNSLSVNNKGTFNVNVDVSRIDGTAINSFSVVPSGTQSITLPTPALNSEGRIQITLTAVGNTQVFVDTDKGLPSNLNIASKACSTRAATITTCNDSTQEQYSRKIEVDLGQ